jgi:hypothetical protein
MRKKTADIFIVSGETMLRIANAHIHACRIANSAGRRNTFRSATNDEVSRP